MQLPQHLQRLPCQRDSSGVSILGDGDMQRTNFLVDILPPHIDDLATPLTSLKGYGDDLPQQRM